MEGRLFRGTSVALQSRCFETITPLHGVSAHKQVRSSRSHERNPRGAMVVSTSISHQKQLTSPTSVVIFPKLIAYYCAGGIERRSEPVGAVIPKGDKTRPDFTPQFDANSQGKS
jgi:hypothetical protein